MDNTFSMEVGQSGEYLIGSISEEGLEGDVVALKGASIHVLK